MISFLSEKKESSRLILPLLVFNMLIGSYEHTTRATGWIINTFPWLWIKHLNDEFDYFTSSINLPLLSFLRSKIFQNPFIGVSKKIR